MLNSLDKYQNKMNEKHRTEIIEKNLATFDCLSSYMDKPEFIASGSIGSVFKIINTDGDFFAAKIEILSTPEDLQSWNAEVRNQKAFHPFSPKVYSVCTQNIGENKFGVIIMELVGAVLDKYLMDRRSATDLDKIIEGISKCFHFMKEHKLTHGDLALFNIAFTLQGRLVLIDFDRASTTEYCPEVDILRLITEWFVSQRSKGTKTMCKENVSYIKTHGISKWRSLYDVPDTLINVKNLGQAWELMYKEYRAKVRAKGLENSVHDTF
jgi:thiamine kinase-like enzyme